MRVIRRRLAIAAVCAAASACSFAAPSAKAVILYRSATRNTSAPTGTNANSGWQWQGNWAGGFTGTPIGSKYFLSAAHVGGGVGQNIYFGGKNHLTTQMWDDPSTDLRIYKISDTFSSWAPIYTGTSETGKRAMVFGRGTQRGSAVTKNNVTKGWKWGTQDKTRSWGENNVSGNINGGTGLGTLLKFTFNRSGTTGALYNEGALSSGDSAGGVFINDNGKWKLAGINYLVDGPFSLSGTNGSGFSASIFDKGGLYVGGDNAWSYTSDTSTDVPGYWYATRVSSRASWIKSIVGTISTGATPYASSSPISVTAVPEPASVGLLAIGASAFLGRRRRSR
jgi:hypothetical protein